MSVDPATVEIVRNALRDIAEEMQAMVMRAAYSTLWQEAGDLSCAVLNPDAEIVGQSERVIPVHTATMTNATRATVEGTGGRDALQPGDVLIQNDPYAGNNHLPDVLMAQPVFGDGALLGFAAVRGHWVDVGGNSPTSYSTHTGEIIQEGLRIPPAKLYRAGDRNDGLAATILANVRDPDERRGDMQAQLAGVRRGAERFEALAERHGAATLAAALETVLGNDEATMRGAIEALPDGEYDAVDYIDGDGLETATRLADADISPLPIETSLQVAGDEMRFDFQGTADQVDGGVNVPLSCTEAGAFYAVKVCLDPGDPGTLGAYRPVSVTAPTGSLVNPTYPAPVVTGNHEGANRVFDVCVRAIAEIDPELAFGAGNGSSNGLSYRSTESGRINREAMMGGAGATPSRDGVNAIRSGLGNTGTQPIERVEQTYDFVTIEAFSIAQDTGGAGWRRGGNAARRETHLADPCDIVTTGDRRYTQPYGLDGGEPGTSATDRHVTPDGEEVPLPSKITTSIPAGSTMIVQPAGGGGFGDPHERAAAAVAADVENGYISADEAREVYGVAVDPETGDIDQDETAMRRSE
ncbi:MAG: hydantoinase B/oxoprolinase family protein [Salinirussus sp.]